ncbi:MAG: hypothetical protein LBL62_04630 [Planctomycetaceae bacterium]|jgi:hypothetical protein|nr:hypothetical protein [Planctomycetaceae bacterium]
MFTEADLNLNTKNFKDGKVRIDRTIVCCEKHSEYRYNNNSQKRVAKIQVDGGLITGQQEKCDWLLINWDDRLSFFIELKGSDLMKAISQIKSSLNIIWNDIQQLSIKTANVRIILSKNRYPNYKNDAEYKQLEQIIKRQGGNIRIESQKMQDGG